MEIEQMKVGPMANLCYVLWEDGDSGAAVIDPAWQPEAVDGFLSGKGLRPELLLLTHGHPDHANAAAYFMKKYGGLALTLYSADAFLLDAGMDPVRFVGDGEELSAGRIRIRTLHTPGHTPGSVSYLAGGAVFTGDTLFVGQCGRADLPGSDPRELRRSLLKLAGLPPDTAVYPGHSYNGSRSTIGVQKERNIFMKLAARGEAEFVKAAV